MAVRVEKPEFNLREKISELDKPVGLKGSELIKSETPQEARDSIGLGPSRKNLFINGDMRIDQRNNGGSITPGVSSTFGVDRWKAVINPSGKFSLQRKTDASLPQFPYYTRLTVTTAVTSLGSSQYELFWQTIESRDMFDRTGFGSGKNAKDLTLSFWVRSSVAGPFSGSLENWDQNRAFVWEVDINNKDTWEHKTVHIPPCTDGSWYIADNGRGAFFMFSLGTTLGSEPNIGWVNAQRLGSSTDIRRIGIQGCTVDITGCQLEIGRVATEFDLRPFGDELALCQRYYERHDWVSSQYVAASIQHDTSSATTSRFVFPYLNRKRTTNPSFTASGSYRGFPPGEAVTLTGVEDNDTATRVNVTRTTSYASGTGILILSNGAGNYFEIDAEI